MGLAKLLAAEVSKTNSGRKPLVLALTGELGAGKTTFVQGLVRSLGVKRKILSPTFLIIKSFSFGRRGFSKIYHIDCYRVGEKDLLALGVKELLREPNIVIIEWADKLRRIIPKSAIWITFHHGRHKNERYITFN